MTMVTDAVDKHGEVVVLLCDEPTGWYHADEPPLDDSPETSPVRLPSG